MGTNSWTHQRTRISLSSVWPRKVKLAQFSTPLNQISRIYHMQCNGFFVYEYLFCDWSWSQVFKDLDYSSDKWQGVWGDDRVCLKGFLFVQRHLFNVAIWTVAYLSALYAVLLQNLQMHAFVYIYLYIVHIYVCVRIARWISPKYQTLAVPVSLHKLLIYIHMRCTVLL